MRDEIRKIQVSREDISALFPPLAKNTHKGDMGRVLCVCGSYDRKGGAMCGAAYFAAASAYSVGAGIVEIFTARRNYESLAVLIPEAVFSLYDTENESDGEICQRLEKAISGAESVILGCGLGKSEAARALVKTVFKNVACPLVIDADGLNIVASDPSLWSLLSAEQRARTVITPHPGEMSRLSEISVDDILCDIRGTAERFARKHGIVCLLKDHNTVITDGKTTFINHSGNPGMATGGSGDVLSGIIGGMSARKMIAEWADEDKKSLSPAIYRTAVAAYIHGLAGDLAAEKHGQYSTIASKILEEIPNVLVDSQ